MELAREVVSQSVVDEIMQKVGAGHWSPTVLASKLLGSCAEFEISTLLKQSMEMMYAPMYHIKLVEKLCAVLREQYADALNHHWMWPLSFVKPVHEELEMACTLLKALVLRYVRFGPVNMHPHWKPLCLGAHLVKEQDFYGWLQLHTADDIPKPGSYREKYKFLLAGVHVPFVELYEVEKEPPFHRDIRVQIQMLTAQANSILLTTINTPPDTSLFTELASVDELPEWVQKDVKLATSGHGLATSKVYIRQVPEEPEPKPGPSCLEDAPCASVDACTAMLSSVKILDRRQFTSGGKRKA